MVDEDDIAAVDRDAADDFDAEMGEVAKADNYDSYIVGVVEECENVVYYGLVTFSDLPVLFDNSNQKLLAIWRSLSKNDEVSQP